MNSKPIIKWAGGKSQLLPQLRPLLPDHMDKYIEPFVGSGAVFFDVAPAKAVLADLNSHLINMYEAVKADVDGIIRRLRVLARQHERAGTDLYYDVRHRFNRCTSGQHAAAMFIYLNKTCYNGLYRVNKYGEFNVPAGRYKNPKILDEERLRKASAQLQHVLLSCQPFAPILLHTAKSSDFAYLDPPYALLKDTSFTSYTSDRFTEADHEALRNVCDALDRRNCKFMLSNSDTPLVRSLYRGYDIRVVTANRAINRRANNRRNTKELVIRNY